MTARVGRKQTGKGGMEATEGGGGEGGRARRRGRRPLQGARGRQRRWMPRRTRDDLIESRGPVEFSAVSPAGRLTSCVASPDASAQVALLGRIVFDGDEVAETWRRPVDVVLVTGAHPCGPTAHGRLLVGRLRCGWLGGHDGRQSPCAGCAPRRWGRVVVFASDGGDGGLGSAGGAGGQGARQRLAAGGRNGARSRAGPRGAVGTFFSCGRCWYVCHRVAGGGCWWRSPWSLCGCGCKPCSRVCPLESAVGAPPRSFFVAWRA